MPHRVYLKPRYSTDFGERPIVILQLLIQKCFHLKQKEAQSSHAEQGAQFALQRRPTNTTAKISPAVTLTLYTSKYKVYVPCVYSHAR